MSFESEAKLDVLVINLENTNQSRVIADTANTALVELRAAQNIYRKCRSSKAFGENVLLAAVVPYLDLSVFSYGNSHVVGVTECHVCDLARVVLKNYSIGEISTVELPEISSCVVQKPELFSAHHINNMSGITIFSFNKNLLEGLDCYLSDFIGFSCIDFSKAPPLDVAINSAGNKAVVFE